MNIAIISGNLTRDPNLHHSNTKKAVVSFTLADNTNPENPEFIPCKVFDKLAEACEKYLKKGSKVLVRGYYHNFSYTNKNNEKVYACEVIANNVEFLTPKQKSEDGAEVPTNPFN